MWSTRSWNDYYRADIHFYILAANVSFLTVFELWLILNVSLFYIIRHCILWSLVVLISMISSNELSYRSFWNEASMPVDILLTCASLVDIWCTSSSSTLSVSNCIVLHYLCKCIKWVGRWFSAYMMVVCSWYTLPLVDSVIHGEIFDHNIMNWGLLYNTWEMCSPS